MTHIFIDESGDLGFSNGSSKFFIITMVISSDIRALERVIKKARKSLIKKYKNNRELHAYHVDKNTRKRILKDISLIHGLKILCIILDKETLSVDAYSKNNYLYVQATISLLNRLNVLQLVSPNESVYACMDRKDTSKYLRHSFEQAILTSLKGKYTGDIKITLKGSHEEKALQVADFISWAIFRKYEQSDLYYYQIIKNLIVEEWHGLN